MMKPHVTIAESYGPAMEVATQAEADDCFEKLVADCMSYGISRDEAEKIARQNLGYCAGYYDAETRERVERLFKCTKIWCDDA